MLQQDPPPGHESFVKIDLPNPARAYVEYKFRTPTGHLFSVTATTLHDARKLRDHWLLFRTSRTPQKEPPP